MATGRGRLEAPNHTQTPNELLDYWMPLMGGAEFKVHMAICRKTFGWHQREDRLSLSQLGKLSGLSKQSVLNGVEAGIARGTIARRPAGDSWAYSLVLDGQLSLAGAPEGGQKTRQGGPKNRPASGPENRPEGGPETRPTKETGNKPIKDTPRGRGLSKRDLRTAGRLEPRTRRAA